MTTEPKRKSVCVIHTGRDEVFTFRRLVHYNEGAGLRFHFHEVVDDRDGLGRDELEQERAALVERVAHDEYVLLLVGNHTSRMAGRALLGLCTGLLLRRPIIAVNLDGSRSWDATRAPEDLEGHLVLSISSELPVLEYALDSWRDEYFRLRSMDRRGAVVYPNDLYETLLANTGPDDDSELTTHRIAL